MISADEKRISIYCYLLGVFGFFPALLILLVRGRDSPFIYAHAVEALTFQVNTFFLFALALLFSPVSKPAPIVLPFLIIYLWVMIHGSRKAATGKLFHCPFVLHFLGKPSKQP